MVLSSKLFQGLWCSIFTITSLPLSLFAGHASNPVSSSHSSCCHKKKKCSKHHLSDDCNVYDFVVVGAGNTGCVIANRLSENGKYTVCLLEYGRDDARVNAGDDDLPIASPANVPQPGDFAWGKYTRGTPAPTEFPAVLLNRGFGHFDWFQKEDADGPEPHRSTTYARHAGWGGCTSTNFTFSIRNAPYNWDKWVNLGLTDWEATNPNSNLIKYYEKVENRSQIVAPGVPFYNPAVAEPNYGAFPNPQQYYGYNGMVPLLNFGPTLLGPNPFTNVLLNAISTALPAYGYPTSLAI